ncbi:antibiotic transporter [Paenibacillus darwinianus]|uniref:Antibiotic transporter n=1 Tax=Paenibacillus darwinianus TaxID=1380763 RepID=A0A9W5W635_9BACL|nr:DMT family transporter [Paenibacillus darwinianus]EXX85206.1 antibiotic transporter [Paenibacillus darwinianus]EXX85270.1 antibiotic transporter [Paenibacillus darwinianus]EXX85455.1 antibiotic transporter [Paenibacillus darwinianus]
MKLVNSPYLLLVLATCIWGSNFVAGKALVDSIPPVTLAATRWGIAFLCLLPFFGKDAWRQRQDYFRQWKMVLFLSVTGVAGFNTLTYMAVQFTGSINAALMNSATPILVLMLASLMMKERLAWAAIPGIAVSMAGVLWIVGRGSLKALLALSFNKGDLLMLLAVFCWALYSVGMKKAAGRFRPSALLLVQTAVATGLLLPLSALELLSVPGEIVWRPGLMIGIVYLGLFASIVAFLSWNRAIELAGPQRCAGYLNLIPLFSAVFATIFTGESIRFYHVLGALLIIAGVYMTNRTRKPVGLKEERPQPTG